MLIAVLHRAIFMGLALGGVFPTSVDNQKLIGVYTLYWIKYT